ncbi:MAG: glucoamylase family protein, partial [Mesotoga infera]
DNADQYTGFAIGWGVTACDGPGGYNGLLGTPPSGNNSTAHRVDGTLAPAGALGSIVFLPDRAIEALEAYYELPELVGRYGLKDSFNLDLDWFASDYIGIDKGITLLMISNYRNDLVWNILMESEYIIDGLDRLGFEVERR